MDIHLKKNALVRTALMAVVLVQGAQMTMANAEIFKCTNKAGKVFYNDKPCPSLDDEKKMRSEKDVLNGYVPPSLMEDKKELKKGNSRSLGDQTRSVTRAKKKRKSKAENIPKIQQLSGGGNRREKVAEEAGDEPRHDSKVAPKGNYADRAGSLEEKRIYLGIRKQVE